MKIKRYIVGLIGVVLVIIISTSYLFVIHNKQKESKEKDRVNLGKEKVIDKTIAADENRHFFEFAKKTLDYYLEESLAVIDLTLRNIQTDGLGKYLIELESIGIDSNYNIDMYQYYMVVHEKLDNELYMMPFGLEMVKGEIDKVRQDLLVTMLKSVNGWGLEREQTWQRWQDTMNNVNYKKDEPTNEPKHSTKTIFYAQSLICFINEYIGQQPEKAFIQISENSLYQEILGFKIKSITEMNDHQESNVVVEGWVRVYEKENIRDYQVEMTYKVVSNPDRTFTIIHQKGQVK